MRACRREEAAVRAGHRSGAVWRPGLCHCGTHSPELPARPQCPADELAAPGIRCQNAGKELTDSRESERKGHVVF